MGTARGPSTPGGRLQRARPAGAPRETQTPSHRGAEHPEDTGPVAEPRTRAGPAYLGLVIISGVRHGFWAHEHLRRARCRVLNKQFHSLSGRGNDAGLFQIIVNTL